MTREPASAIQKVAEDSRLWRGVEAFAQAWSTAWDRSTVGRVVATSAVRVRQAAPAGRLRVAASIAAWASAWHLAGLTMLPPYVTSGLPRVWFVMAGVMALLVALAADGFARAWDTSALARRFRRLAAPESGA